VKQALAQSNPDVAPHPSFADLGGHGYATVRVSADQMETEVGEGARPVAMKT
jgi:alkaline phosphatase D